MSKYSLSKSKKSDEELQSIFDKQCNSSKYPDLPLIFKICLNSRDRFVDIDKVSTEENYIAHWILKYEKEFEKLPSEHIATPKNTCNDPALTTIVGSSGLVDGKIEEAEKSHSLFMSAENIQGKLLEEYISSEVSKFGFMWCRGGIMRAIDFCNKDGSCTIQIKNKNNTENSSSSAIRNGTEIRNWYRLSSIKLKKRPMPKYHWDELNDIINECKTQSKDEVCAMSEEKYIDFIKKVVAANKRIICSEFIVD